MVCFARGNTACPLIFVEPALSISTNLQMFSQIWRGGHATAARVANITALGGNYSTAGSKVPEGTNGLSGCTDAGRDDGLRRNRT